MESIVTAILAKAATEFLSNPEMINSFFSQFVSSCHHTAEDVAQDALDAYEAGNLTKAQTMKIIETCLQEKQPTIDVKSKRLELEKLFH